MPVKIKLKDINVAKLDTRTVILLTQFLRKVRNREDCNLQMQQPKIVRDVVRYAKKSGDPELIVLSMRIKNSIASQVKNKKPEEPLINTDY